MINKITRKKCKDWGLDFDELLQIDCDPIESYKQYRKGSNFFTKWVLDIDEESCKEVFPDHLFLIGLWETNTFIDDTNHGYDSDEIDELTRVKKVEKEIKTIKITYEPIEDENVS